MNNGAPTLSLPERMNEVPQAAWALALFSCREVVGRPVIKNGVVCEVN